VTDRILQLPIYNFIFVLHKEALFHILQYLLTNIPFKIGPMGSVFTII